MMKCLRVTSGNNKGFTLVEVIVVAVIVLILAAVAIPLYNGYIRDARQASVENAAGALATALGGAVQSGNHSISASSFNASNVAQALIITAGQFSNTNQILVPANMTVAIGATAVTVTHGAHASVTAMREYTTP